MLLLKWLIINYARTSVVSVFEFYLHSFAAAASLRITFFRFAVFLLLIFNIFFRCCIGAYLYDDYAMCAALLFFSYNFCTSSIYKSLIHTMCMWCAYKVRIEINWLVLNWPYSHKRNDVFARRRGGSGRVESKKKINIFKPPLLYMYILYRVDSRL